MDMEQITARIEKTLAGLGYELVLLQKDGRKTLRVFMDKPEGVTIDDCVFISEQLSRLLEAEFADFDYSRLEVSSPGLDRPLVKLDDFSRFSGNKAEVHFKIPKEGRRKWSGMLVGVEGHTIFLKGDSQPIAFTLEEITKARLVPEWGINE
jgi:ribosome maturation factor RimP